MTAGQESSAASYLSMRVCERVRGTGRGATAAHSLETPHTAQEFGKGSAGW